MLTASHSWNLTRGTYVLFRHGSQHFEIRGAHRRLGPLHSTIYGPC